MNLYSGQTYTRPIYCQTSCGFDLRIEACQDFDISLYNDLGSATGIYLYNGKIFGLQNKFLGAFDYGSTLDINVQIEDNLCSTWINNTLCAASQPLFSTPFSFITGFGFSNSTSDLDISCSVFGELPNLEFGSLRTSDLSLFTGYVKSLSNPIRITGVVPNSLSIVSFDSGPTMSGQYVLSGKNLYSGDTENITFLFDHGSVETGIPVYYRDTTSPTGLLNITIGDVVYDYFTRSGETIPVAYQDISIISSWAVDTNLEYQLSFVGRSGESIVTGTGIGYGYYTGYLNGSGWLYSDTLTGLIEPYGLTGSGSGYKYDYTTGEYVYEYIISVVGTELGQPATGILYGEITGNVGAGSGRYIINEEILGTPVTSVWEGGVHLSPVGVYTGRVTYTGVLSKYMSVFSSGNFTGTAVNQNNSGDIHSYNIIAASISDLSRYDYQYSYDNFYNYKERDLYFGQTLIDLDPIYIRNGLFSTGLRISYEQYYYQGLTDYASLSVANEYVSYNYNLVRETL